MVKLSVPSDGPCAGHPCDNCRICQRGRCCRNDDPHYQLPGLGEWDGPMYGELGKLEDDGDRAMCHACGRFFRHLGNHVWNTHNLTADEYRAIFGLKQGTGLVGPGLFAIMSRNTKRELQQHPERVAMFTRVLHDMTPEQRSHQTRGRKLRLESKIDVTNQVKRKEASRKARATFAARVARGEASYYRMPSSQAKKMSQKAHIAWAERRTNPEINAAWRKKISDARGGRKTVYCEHCGEGFDIQKAEKRRYCGNTCYNAAKVGHIPEGLRRATQDPALRRQIGERMKTRIAAGAVVRNALGQLVPAGSLHQAQTRIQQQYAGKIPQNQPWFLTEKQWLVLRAHVTERLSYQCIADHSGVDPSTAKSLAKRGALLLDRWLPTLDRAISFGIDEHTPPLLAEIALSVNVPPETLLRLGFGACTFAEAIERLVEVGAPRICPKSYANWLTHYKLRNEWEQQKTMKGAKTDGDAGNSK